MRDRDAEHQLRAQQGFDGEVPLSEGVRHLRSHSPGEPEVAAPLREAVSEAVDTCIENNVLRDILLEQKAEVIQKKLAKGRSIEAIAGELEVAPETVQELAKQT